MDEFYYEKLLNITTTDLANWGSPSNNYHPYEPTTYEALEALSEKYPLSPHDHVVDFGSGKGRLLFFLYHLFHCYVTGIEMDQTHHIDALKNVQTYQEKHILVPKKINLVCAFAEAYAINKEDNKFYFFNPFKLSIFIKIVDEIIESAREHPRKVDIILYYPTLEYCNYLEANTDFMLIQEIDLPELIAENHREKFSIYRMS